MRIGIDFDNTIACYDEVFSAAAIEIGLLPSGFVGGKGTVRETLRNRADGELEWQRLQGQAYGRFMPHASLFDGVGEFFRTAKINKVDIAIISHKTEFGHFDDAKINLHHAALKWMKENRFFDTDGFGVLENQVYFMSTRAEKISHIVDFAPDIFIDDLPEIFEETGFPERTRKILFTNDGGKTKGSFECLANWQAIGRLLFAS